MIPDGHGDIMTEDFEKASPKIVKTHGLIPQPITLQTDAGEHIRPITEIEKCIYIIRNPNDLVCSVFDFVLLNSGVDTTRLNEAMHRKFFDDFVANFVDSAGDLGYRSILTHNLNEHVTRWTDLCATVPSVMLRYEDLLNHPVAQLRKLAALFGVEKTDGELATIAERCSFRRLQALEEKMIDAGDSDENNTSEFYRPWRNDGYEFGRRFFNRGVAGRGLELLTREQISKIRFTFAPVFARFNY